LSGRPWQDGHGALGRNGLAFGDEECRLRSGALGGDLPNGGEGTGVTVTDQAAMNGTNVEFEITLGQEKRCVAKAALQVEGQSVTVARWILGKS